MRIAGSSPRAWGTVRNERRHQHEGRFIPTCVGNRRALHATAHTNPVHPHVRGEQENVGLPVKCEAGSSPRAWGTGVLLTVTWLGSRFIPTCVGNRCPATRRACPIPVHPHVRGEQARDQRPLHDNSGSSPRAWGTVLSRQADGPHHRFIPTCVGNSIQRRDNRPAPAVHPHVRGEQPIELLCRLHATGSSPRAWGTAIINTWGALYDRFIPTCVGNSPRNAFRHHRHSVHPHVRGEQWCVSPRSFRNTGSSPRAWGTVPQIAEMIFRGRFIPTCVGNSS